MTKRVSIGRLLPGDEIFERRGRRVERIGVVDRVEKNVRLRSVTVHLRGGGGWSQNWAAHVLVKREAAA